ncbi:MAG: TIR domain-containing protein [bacterium]|nr:TIR domain-containing protein [bacterium]
MSDAFISYSRRDKQFVQRLRDSFQTLNRDVWVDWEDIPLTSDWRREIQDGIEKANTFVFVVSPDSAKSEECRIEIELAVEQGKRIVPVVYRDVAGDEYKALHPAISAHNWIFCRDGQEDYDVVFQTLINAMDTDLEHVRNHTRLLVRAREWEDKKQDPSYLLSGSDIAVAEGWLASAHGKKPVITDLHTQYILASRERATRQTRTLLTAASIALVVMAVLAVVAAWQAIQARINATEARSLELAANAQVAIVNNDFEQAVALSQEANRVNSGEPQVRQILEQSAFTPGTRRVFTGHTGDIFATAVNADGTQVLSGSSNGELLLWDINTSVEPVRVAEGLRTINMLAFNPTNAADALSAGNDGLLRWTLPGSENQPLVYEAPNAEGTAQAVVANSVAYLPDGTRAVAGYADGTVILWNLETGEEEHRFEDHEQPVTALDVGTRQNEDGEDEVLIAAGEAATSGSFAGKLIVWNAATQEEAWRFEPEGNTRFRSVVFSPDGQSLLAGLGDGTARVWNVANGEVVRSLAAAGSASAHIGAVWSVDYSDDGRFAITGGEDNTLRLWLVGRGSLVRIFEGHDNPVRSVHVIPGQLRAITGSRDDTLRYWDLISPFERNRFYGFNSLVTAVAFNPEENLALAAAADGSLRWWNLDSAEASGLEDGSAAVASVVVDIAYNASNDTVFVAAASSPSLSVFDPLSGETVFSFPTIDERSLFMEAVAINQDGTRGVAASGVTSGSTVFVVDLQSGEILNEYVVEGEYINEMALHPNGTEAAVVTSSGRVFIINLETGDQRSLEGHTPFRAIFVRYNPDGSVLATGGQDNLVMLWDAASGERLHTLIGHNGFVEALAFNGDGTQLFSGSPDETIIVWDVASGTELYRLYTTGSPVQSIAVTQDGNRVLFGSTDTVVRLWEPEAFTPEGLISWIGENRYTPTFSCVDRERYRLAASSACAS